MAHGSGREPAAAPMLRRVSQLEGCIIAARDGDIGDVVDLYFDDTSWTVRYLVIDTGRWLPGRKVLLLPSSITEIELDEGRLVTDLTRAEVEASPPIDTARPVSRHHESDLLAYYGFPYYWTGPYRWGPAPFPVGLRLAPSSTDRDASTDTRPGAHAERHLRSVNSIKGLRIQATDGEIGAVTDLLVDEQDWAIRYLIVDPHRWWPGPHVLIPRDWIRSIGWDDSEIFVDVGREKIRNAPSWEPGAPVTREHEERLHRHYGRAGYWEQPLEAWRVPPAA